MIHNNGKISKINIKRGDNYSLATFSFYNKETGFLDCKTWNLKVISEIERAGEGAWIEIIKEYPKKENWMSNDGVKKYKVSLFVEEINVISQAQPTLNANPTVEMNINESRLKQQIDRIMAEDRPQPTDVGDEIIDLGEIDWEGEFN